MSLRYPDPSEPSFPALIAKVAAFRAAVAADRQRSWDALLNTAERQKYGMPVEVEHANRAYRRGHFRRQRPGKPSVW